MVKPDLKHNYYSDLELPTNASIDDIRKAYRKLALQYHPDRNAGHEEDVVPKFQAIQAANEVLGDPGTKQKYDNDRRKAGLYPAFPSRQPTPTSPYAATSAYPPPPRRTGPGAGAFPRQPPPPGGPVPGAPNGGMPGADRFSNFPRTNPTAKKDPAQDRTNMFKAWQNMNSTDQRPQSRFFNPGNPQAPPQSGPPPPGATRPRPPPPPRADPKVAPEPGMKYKVPPQFDPETAEKRQTAWSAFQQANAGRPGMQRTNSARTPKRGGFNPNAPGSDERPAPTSGNPYAHHKSKSGGYDRPRPHVNVPPPPPGAPPSETSSTGPTSPTSPRMRRPYADPLQHTPSPEEVPFAEANRVSTPYTRSFTGEKTDFSGDGLRRSKSTHDNTKLSPEDAASRSRARSSSPQRTAKKNPPHFDFYSSGASSVSGEGETQTPEDIDSSNSQDPKRPGTAPFDRPKKTPTPPSRLYNGRTSPPPPMPGMPNSNGATDGAQSDHERSNRNPKSGSNMYAAPPLSSFNSRTWTSHLFGSRSTSRAGRGRPKIPTWAIPSSVNPTLKISEKDADWLIGLGKTSRDEFVTAADKIYVNASSNEQEAYLRFQAELRKSYDNVPGNLDMDVFLKLAAMATRGESTGDEILDRILRGILLDFDSVGLAHNELANSTSRHDSFTFPNYPDLFETTTNTKSRSEENINTSFTPEGWSGSFTGEPGYFEPPTSNTRAQPSRTTSTKTATSQRSATMDVPTPNTAPSEQVPQRPWGSDGTPSEYPRTAATLDPGFNTEEWQRTFENDSTFAWPPPPPNPPSPVKGGPAPRGRKASRVSGRKTAGTKNNPHVLDEDDTVEVEGADGRPEMGAPVDDGDKMDIDQSPPAQQPQPGGQENGARVYAVPPSEWRRLQEQKTRGRRKSSHATRKAQQQNAALNTNLDDLRHVEPLAPNTAPSGGFNLADMKSDLPFQSQASNDQPVPRTLQLPPLPQPPQEPQHLTKANWHAYATAFGEYVKAFHGYNTRLLQHFQSREQVAQGLCAGGMEWLEAAGDSSGGLGFGGYAVGVKEDEKVRENWNLAWEKHKEYLETFRGVRDRVRRSMAAGGLT